MALSTFPLVVLTVLISMFGCGGSLASEFTAGCTAEWNALVEQEPTSRKTDATGYIRVAAKDSLVGRDRKNEHSFWAHFKCQKDKLVHDHCRFGEKDEKGFLYIPVTKHFQPLEDVVPDEWVGYFCRESSGSELRAVVAPNYSMELEQRDKCRRIPGSDWCGVPSSIAGCQDEWNVLQKNALVDEEGWIRLKSQREPKEELYLKLACAAKNLAIEQCSPNRRLHSLSTMKYYRDNKMNPGTYLKEGKFFYTCPAKRDGGYTAEELAKAIFMVPWKEGPPPPELKGFKIALPAGIDESCAADWRTLTLDSDRKVDEKGYVEVVKDEYLFGSYAGYGAGDIWVLFKCTPSSTGTSKGKGSMLLEHCRVDGKLLPPATSFYKVYMPVGNAGSGAPYYHNCGSRDKTTPADVAKYVTRSKQAAKGLKVVDTLSKI